LNSPTPHHEVLNNLTPYHEVLSDEESLRLFLRNVQKFDKAFSDAMVEGTDFNLSLEVHGNNHKLIHSRVKTDRWDRPKNSEKQV